MDVTRPLKKGNYCDSFEMYPISEDDFYVNYEQSLFVYGSVKSMKKIPFSNHFIENMPLFDMDNAKRETHILKGDLRENFIKAIEGEKNYSVIYEVEVTVFF